MHAAISRIWGIHPHLAASGAIPIAHQFNSGFRYLLSLCTLLLAFSGIRTPAGPRKRSFAVLRRNMYRKCVNDSRKFEPSAYAVRTDARFHQKSCPALPHRTYR